MTRPPSSLPSVLLRLLPSAPAARPAVLRVGTGLYTVWYLGRRVRLLRRIHRTDPALFAPVGPCRVLRRPFPPVVADALVTVELLATVAFTLGIAHRVIGPVHSALLLWTLSYRNSWSMIFHIDNNLVLHTAVLGCTRSADALSLAAPTAGRALGHDWRYGVPGNVMNAVTTATYCLSGVAKVAGPLGWGWARGESLRSQIAADGLRKRVLGAGGAPLGVRLHRHTWLFRLMATGSLALELLAPLALLDRRLGRLWAVGAFGMHWGIKAIMGITFRHQLSGVLYLPFLELDRLLGRRFGVRMHPC